jgi:hypothetical protein
MFWNDWQGSDIEFEEGTLTLKFDLQGLARLAGTAVCSYCADNWSSERRELLGWNISVGDDGVGNIVGCDLVTVLEF